MAKSPRAADVSSAREESTRHIERNTDGNRDLIERRAYERYEARGREEGLDQEDWFEAEREFQQHTSGSATADDRSDRGSDD